MKRVYQAFYAALLVTGLAGAIPHPTMAGDGTHWDSDCNCRRPDSEYNTRRYTLEAPRVITHKRVVNHTRVVRGETKLIQENRLIVHVRPIINREVVVHRTNTIVKDVLLHKVNTINRVQEEHRHEVVDRYVEGSVRHVLERREIRGCNCGHGGGSRYDEDELVSYRD
jgi:hypothetical protein